MFCQNESVYLKFSQEEQDEAKKFCEKYKTFLDNAKTEREAASTVFDLAKKNGFKEKISQEEGSKIIFKNRGKALALIVVGKEPVENGVNIIASHIDSPRLDLKQNPLYQDTDIAFLKTHYYGGIKKYQWTTTPLSLHGVIVTKQGTVDIRIGEDESDPVFCVTDLLPHLAQKQMSKKGSEIIEGEALNIIFGSEQRSTDGKDKVKDNILVILKDKYGIEEEDFISAELSAVPAFKAKDVGLDASFVGAYGQDDKVCAYAALEAIFSLKVPNKTAVLFLADKEEIGSMGNTGMKSTFFMGAIQETFPKANLHKILSNSSCLSADVDAAYDPNYKDVYEKNNCSQVNHGLILTKYTGSRGKSGSSDASAEFVGKIRQILNDNNVAWQIGELGKVDAGGGGTVAQYIANLNVDVIDCGVPILSMHAPFELAAKMDIYMANKGYKAFLNN